MSGVLTLLRGQSYMPGSQPLTLVDGLTDTGYTSLLPGRDFGNAEWEAFYSGPRGTLGAKSAGMIPQSRKLVLPFRVVGSTKDDLHDKLNAIHRLTDELRRAGGRITWRAHLQNYRQHFDVLAGSAAISDWPKSYDHSHRVTQVISAVCSPYLQGDPYDIVEPFDTASTLTENWTEDEGTGVLAFAGGALRSTTSGETRWRYTSRGFLYSDVQVRLKLTTAGTVTNYEAGVFLNAWLGATETYLSAELVGGQLRIVKRDNGTPTTLTSTAFSVAANTTYWLQLRREGKKLFAAVYTSEPTPLAAPAAQVEYTLNFFGISASDIQLFPPGLTGFRVVAAAAGEVYDDFRAEPFTYNPILLPDERPLAGRIIGDAPARAEISITQSGGGLGFPLWALLGWRQRPLLWNQCWNGDFEEDVDGWSVAAVSGVTGAATSITRSTTAARNKYGGANGQVVAPATANVGTTFRIRRRFHQGHTYVILVWASSAAQTTLSRCRLGASGDIASSTAQALGTTPKLFPAVWTPTQDRNLAYACLEITAATATTYNIDGVVVCDSRPANLNANITNSAQSATVLAVPDDWPQAPFLAIIEAESGAASQAEIVRVESIAGSTLTLTRGLEGTAGVAHNAGVSIIPLPELRGHLEGKGAQPPSGIIEAESCDTGDLGSFAITTDATARLGERLAFTSGGGVGGASATWLVDPNLLVPDDYTPDELAVEVWGRLGLDGDMTWPLMARLAIAPETASNGGGTLSSVFGAIRYAEEFGFPGRNTVEPTGSAECDRIVRLGTLRMPIDRDRAQRYRLWVRLEWANSSAGNTVALDWLLLAPVDKRCLNPTAKPNDKDFPFFINTTSETTKKIRTDLSGLIAAEPKPAQADSGLGGSLIEIPYGAADVIALLSNLIPDDPTSNSNDEAGERLPGALHVAVTPQFTLARGS